MEMKKKGKKKFVFTENESARCETQDKFHIHSDCGEQCKNIRMEFSVCFFMLSLLLERGGRGGGVGIGKKARKKRQREREE